MRKVYSIITGSLIIVGVACGAVDETTMEHHTNVMQVREEVEVTAEDCQVVQAARDHLANSPEFQTEQDRLEQATAQIEAEHSGLIGRMQALQEELMSGDYPYTLLSRGWIEPRDKCIAAGFIQE